MAGQQCDRNGMTGTGRTFVRRGRGGFEAGIGGWRRRAGGVGDGGAGAAGTCTGDGTGCIFQRPPSSSPSEDITDDVESFGTGRVIVPFVVGILA